MLNLKMQAQKLVINVREPLLINSHHEWNRVRGLGKANLVYTDSAHDARRCEES